MLESEAEQLRFQNRFMKLFRSEEGVCPITRLCRGRHLLCTGVLNSKRDQLFTVFYQALSHTGHEIITNYYIKSGIINF